MKILSNKSYKELLNKVEHLEQFKNRFEKLSKEQKAQLDAQQKLITDFENIIQKQKESIKQEVGKLNKTQVYTSTLINLIKLIRENKIQNGITIPSEIKRDTINQSLRWELEEVYEMRKELQSIKDNYHNLFQVKHQFIGDTTKETILSLLDKIRNKPDKQERNKLVSFVRNLIQ